MHDHILQFSKDLGEDTKSIKHRQRSIKIKHKGTEIIMVGEKRA